MVKNTAALDYAAPLLWKVRQVRPDVSVSVLYCRLTRHQFLRSGQFYSSLFRAAGIREYDFADFLPMPERLANPLWRALYRRSERDTDQAGPAGGHRGAGSEPWERRLSRRARLDAILPALRPDLVLLDHTASGAAQLRGAFNAYMAGGTCRVVLLPHAPHHAEPVALAPFDRQGDFLPAFCSVWMPFIHERTWEAAPAQRDQFTYVGYPGLDDEWLRHLVGTPPPGTPRARRPGPRRCLFVIRRFLPAGATRAAGDNAYVYDHDEFMRYVRLLHTAVQQAPVPIEVVVKPHPSNNFRAVDATLHAAGITNWRISYEPIYSLLADIDLVVSLYSTVFFMPSMAGIPSIVLHTSTQDLVNQWDRMAQLYDGFRHYLRDPEALPATLVNLVADLDAARAGADVAADQAHLRTFYPDGALGRALAAMGLGDRAALRVPGDQAAEQVTP